MKKLLMPDVASTNLETDHQEALQAYQDDGYAESRSEAIKQTSRAELARKGYMNGYSNGAVQWIAYKLGELSAIVGVAWLAFFYFFPVQYRAGAVFWFVVALLSFGVAELAKRDTLSNLSVFNREKA